MEHYYSENQSSQFKIKKISQRILGKEFEFFTSPGIFSKDQVDKGTLILAESMQVSENDEVLDIGCGIGILGIVAAKTFDAKITLTDINKRAITLARKNLELNKIKGTILQGNIYQKISGKFDVILSNPPQNAGKEICFKIIEGAKEFIKEDGTLQIVARPNKGGKTLSRKMEEVFRNVIEIARKSGYCVYLSRKII